jgi:hypothetical protein
MDHLYVGISPVLAARFSAELAASFPISRFLIGIWCVVSTLEWIANLSLFKQDGLLAWDILSLRSGFVFSSGVLAIFSHEQLAAWILGLRLAAGVAVMITASPSILSCVFLLLIATYWLLAERTWLGADGSDQMGQIVCIGALLISTGLTFHKLDVSFAGTLLIGGQLTISYFVSGFSKLLSPAWRRGIAIVGVMGTHSYGHGVAAKISSRNARLARLFCWLVIGGETLFLAAVAAPQGILVIVLACFLVLHFCNAYFMGLNAFVWSFAATYPSVLLLNHLLGLGLAILGGY